MNWTEITTIIFGTGIISAIAQILLGNYLNKQFFRFSNLYKDKLDIIRELYRLLIKAEGGLQILMTSPLTELKVNKDENETEEYKSEKEEFRKKTFSVISAFFNYYEENEIVFENEIVKCFDELRKKFQTAIKSHNYASIMESSRPSKAWENAAQAKQDAIDSILSKDIPDLKKKLKKIFQDRYKLLETN